MLFDGIARTCAKLNTYAIDRWQTSCRTCWQGWPTLYSFPKSQRL